MVTSQTKLVGLGGEYVGCSQIKIFMIVYDLGLCFNRRNSLSIKQLKILFLN